MGRDRVGVLFLAAVLSACGAPKTPQEFREAMRAGSPMTTANTFEVERPFKDVTATLRDRAQRCLDVRVEKTCINCVFSTTHSDEYLPTLVTRPERTELHLQSTRGAVIEPGAPPAGNYRIVLDATPIDGRRTRIDSYSLSWDDKFIRVAMESWARGDNLNCPDLTRR